MNPLLTDPSIRAADTDILVGTAESAHHMSLKMCQNNERIIVRHMRAVRHLLHPLTARNRKQHRSLFIHDVHRAESPAVDLQGLSMIFGIVAITVIVGIRLNNHSILKLRLCCQKLLHPRTRNDVWSLRLTGMQLYANLACDLTVDLLINLL